MGRRLGRLDEATAWGDRAAGLGAIANPRCQQAKAKVLARRGEHAGAERLVREPVEMLDLADMLNEQGAA